MATRNNTFILKRSNVVNKIPVLSGLTLGELALNTADSKLYSLYTGGLSGATEVRQIGWDRLSISGGTLYGALSATTIESNSLITNSFQLNSSGDTAGYLLSSDSYGNSSWISEQDLTLWSLVVTGNKLLSGGASYVSGLTFSITQLTYIINGVIYEIPTASFVTLNTGDVFYDRIDVIVADISGNTSVVEGTPSANPEKPDIDEATQVEVTFVSIPANSSTPDISLLLIYDENTGYPTEWLFSTNNPTRIKSNSTNQSYSGTKSIEVSGVTLTTSFLNLTPSSQIDTSQYSTIQFAIKNRIANNTTNQLRFSFLNVGGSQIGSLVIMNAANTAGYIQYSSSNTSTWQLISIPLWKFGLTNTIVNSLKIQFVNTSTNQSNLFLDKIQLVEGIVDAPPTNSWLNVKGDLPTLITAPTPNSTLTISGGTNIGSRVNGTSVILDLDNYISLSGITVNDINVSGNTKTVNFQMTSGATNGYVLSSDSLGNATWIPGSSISGVINTYVTGFTFSSNTLTISQNQGQSPLTTSITTVDLSNVFSAVTFNIGTTGSISATTFYGSAAGLTGINDFYVTGGTYSSGNLTLNRQNGSVIVTGLTSNDTYVTGFTYSNNNLTINQNGGQSPLNINISVMSGLTVSNNTNLDIVTASSISNLNFINFTTGSTVTGTTVGTVYFDNVEKALSYNTSINQGVTVNLGQQNYIRVFNNSGTDIQRGKALELLSASNGLPAVTLAINRQNGSNIIGVSSEIIPNNSEGIAITNGIISNIPLTGMSVGGLIYASDSIPGELDDATKYFNFPLTARTNQVGYVIQTGSTDGKLFVVINNENTILSLTDLQRNVLEGNGISTGVFDFKGIFLSTGNTFNVGHTQAFIIDNTSDPIRPTALYVQFNGQSGLTTPYLTTDTETYVLLTSGGTISLQPTFPTPQQRRLGIYLGKIGHGNKTSLINAFNEPDLDISPLSQLRDMFTPVKLINDGVVTNPNGVNLNFNTSAGKLWGLGINFINDQLNPSSLTIIGNSPTTFQYRTQTGGTASNTTLIDPLNYDLNGVITPIGSPAKQSTNQRIFLLQNGQFRIQYGQHKYIDLAAAIAGAQNESFTTFSNFRDNAILIGVLSVASDATNLSSSTQALFHFVSKFGELGGGTAGISTTTLQQAYNNSTNPEIVTNSTLNSVQFRGGTGSDTDKNISIENNAGSETAYITAGGGGVFDSLSATTYYNLPTTISPAVNLFNYNNFI